MNDFCFILLHINERMDTSTLRYDRSISRRGELAVTECNGASQTSPNSEGSLFIRGTV